MTAPINLNDLEMRKLIKDTGLSRLELMGVIGALNTILVPKEKRRVQAERDEMMGRDIY